MKVIIDCNVWISFLLGFQKELIQNMLTNEHIEIFVCPQLTLEIKEVSSRPKIQSRIAGDDVEKLFRIFKAYCQTTRITHQAKSSIRDSKDLYLLSLAESIQTDYIISGDNVLRDLGKHKDPKILSPTEFRQIL